MGEEKKVSLKDLKLDEEQLERVSSPRSIEAMRRQGMVQEELQKMSRQQIVQMVGQKYGKKIKDQNVIDLYEKHFEERRQMKIRLLLDVREEVVQEQQQGLWNSKMQKSQMQQGSVISENGQILTVHDMEQQLIKEMNRRRDMDVRNIMDQELRIQEIMKKMKQKDEQTDKNMKKLQMQQNSRTQKKEEHYNQMSQHIDDYQKNEQKQKDEEEEQRRKDDEKRLKGYEALLKQQQMQIEKQKEMNVQKQMSMDNVQMQRQSETDKQIQLKKEEDEKKEKRFIGQKKEQQNQRENHTKERQQRMIGVYRNGDEIYQKKQDDKLEQMKLKDQKSLQSLSRVQQEQHTKSMNLRQIGEKRKEQTFQNDQKFQKYMSQKEQDMQQKNKHIEKQNVKREQGLEQFSQRRYEKINTNQKNSMKSRQQLDLELQQRNTEIMDRLKQQEMKQEQHQKQVDKDNTYKAHIEFLKQLDSEDNNQRLKNIQYMKEQMVMQKLQQDEERLHLIQKDRNKLKNKQNMIRRAMQSERDSLVREMRNSTGDIEKLTYLSQKGGSVLQNSCYSQNTGDKEIQANMDQSKHSNGVVG